MTDQCLRTCNGSPQCSGKSYKHIFLLKYQDYKEALDSFIKLNWKQKITQNNILKEDEM